MSDKKTNIVFTNYTRGNDKPTKIKIGTWTNEQKQEFLNLVMGHRGWDYVEHCSFNVHFDKSVIHLCAFNNPKTFMPIRPKNKRNELIIEVIPRIENANCWVRCDRTCPICVQNGECDALLIREYVGRTLFSEKYTNQK